MRWEEDCSAGSAPRPGGNEWPFILHGNAEKRACGHSPACTRRQTIALLAEVVLVAHDRREIEVVRREAEGSWSRHISGDGSSARIDSLDLELPVADVYRDPLA